MRCNIPRRQTTIKFGRFQPSVSSRRSSQVAALHVDVLYGKALLYSDLLPEVLAVNCLLTISLCASSENLSSTPWTGVPHTELGTTELSPVRCPEAAALSLRFGTLEN